MSSDAGLSLLREIERGADLAGLVAKCLTDLREPGKVRHSLEDIIRFRIMMIAAGYEDGNDATELRDRSFWISTTLLMPFTATSSCACSMPTMMNTASSLSWSLTATGAWWGLCCARPAVLGVKKAQAISGV